MVKLKAMKWFVAMLVIFAAVSVVSAEGDGHARPEHKSLADRVAELGLEAEVEAQVLALVEEYKAAAGDRSEFAALKEEFVAAKEAGDEEALAALHEQAKELWQARRQLREDLKVALSELLTEEQLAQLFPHRRRGHRGRHGMFGGHARLGMGGDRAQAFLQKMGLTAEQIEQAEAIFAEAREAAAAAETHEAKAELFKAAMQQVHDEVLTEEQQAQVEQMKVIHEEVKAAVEAAETREEKMAAIRAGFQRFRDEVLTEEQRQALDEGLAKFSGCHGQQEEPAEEPEEQPVEQQEQEHLD